MNNTHQDLFETHTHPFIVKIWLEETVEDDGRASWRGYITHVPTGARRYIKKLSDVNDFITPFLKEMGVKFGIWGQICNRLGFLKLQFFDFQRSKQASIWARRKPPQSARRHTNDSS
jgi:hypothetical protein